ncbi:uncharacterized protein LOC129567469 [Sitodiplosis mosellana]|uniref:uncharacterized protein LOC129567469 n=1 Tax=Sitodiplosis mosellana TaxID=263140 RepID=UPI002444505E|nr:uncharacterized protein LOC129567469 [Sitodiplosis mosellana]
MVTCNFDSIKKMERPRRNTTSSSNSSGFRLLDDQCDTVSSVSRNSIYKLKIDAMFDDNRSMVSQRLDDINPSISQRRRSSRLSSAGSIREAASSGIRCGRSNSIRSNSIRGGSSTNIQRGSTRESSGRGTNSNRSSSRVYRHSNPINVTRTMTTTTTTTTAANIIEYGVKCVNNKVQKQIERMFTDVANDETTCSFAVRCLGSLPLQSKVTSLFELQEPLRKLYIAGSSHNNQNTGYLDICEGGLRIRTGSTPNESQPTPFQHIAVWSAVKFVMSQSENSAAFLPLITDPENLDKKSLFQPLSGSDRRRLSSGSHAPIFTVVMRSKQPNQQSKQLECHAFVCQTPENAIVIAATLYQSLLAHMSSSQTEKQRKPRNQNGVSCVSIASSSGANRYGSSRASLASSGNRAKPPTIPLPPPPIPSPRLARMQMQANSKRLAENSMSSDTDNIVRNALLETSSSSDQRKRRSYKTRRAPPVPTQHEYNNRASDLYKISSSYRVHQMNAQSHRHHYQTADQVGGDIMTRVAIPRSGSFLNTSGLARYKSRATRRAKSGGGGGSPLGFSELFNEFRLQENLHSLDDILNAIINSEGMSFNDLKPIYKEFLLKLAVTLTKDELYQRSKSIMRRQKKKLMRRNKAYQYPRKTFFFGSYGLKRVFRFSKYFFQRRKKTTAASLDGLAKKRVMNSRGSSATVTNNRITTTEIHSKQNYVKKHHRSSKAVTSGSDLSETQNELTFSGQNRNSSSGYVSYSECSAYSDECTCSSADRCYCSLGPGRVKLSRRLKESKRSSSYIKNTDTLISCHTDDKCYCSLDDGEGTADDLSTATYCDTESCNSTTKCYCKHRVVQVPGTTASVTKKVNRTCVSDSLALDYELFTVGNDRGQRRHGSSKTRSNQNAKHIRSQEALSVKKSVEMAAVFADVKLSQTTDIKHLKGDITSSEEERLARNNRRNSVISTRSQQMKRIGSMGPKCNNIIPNVIEAAEQNPIFRKNTQKINEMYQTITPKVVGATLEDSLGYLP